ncbi:MAG: hypothetical protein GX625_13415, partial [Clostridiaceae bacterium]|nr:hypothetical protein [Clostridiaceae bacterium]
ENHTPQITQEGQIVDTNSEDVVVDHADEQMPPSDNVNLNNIISEEEVEETVKIEEKVTTPEETSSDTEKEPATTEEDTTITEENATIEEDNAEDGEGMVALDNEEDIVPKVTYEDVTELNEKIEMAKKKLKQIL